MRYAIIENGVVTNVVVADAEFAAQNGWIECSIAGLGWTYLNGVFNEPTKQNNQNINTSSKEELLAQLQALQEQIQLLG